MHNKKINEKERSYFSDVALSTICFAIWFSSTDGRVFFVLLCAFFAFLEAAIFYSLNEVSAASRDRTNQNLTLPQIHSVRAKPMSLLQSVWPEGCGYPRLGFSGVRKRALRFKAHPHDTLADNSAAAITFYQEIQGLVRETLEDIFSN
ncbi:hypothetical protein K2Y11_16665 [bacterium]|nr:hypothetical protein [bacterium]